MLEIKIKGLEELLSNLKATQASAIKLRAAKAGGLVLKKAVEDATPVSIDQHSAGSDALPPGFAKADVVLATEKGTAKTDSPAVIVKYGKYSAHVMNWQEFGFVHTRKSAKTGKEERVTKNVGRIRAAFEASQQEIADAIQKQLEEDIVKAFNGK